MGESYDSQPHGGKNRSLGSPGGFRILSNDLFFKHLPRGRSYTVIEALLSLHLDIHQHQCLKAVREYSRIWRRTRPWARARIAEFEADPVYQRLYQGVDKGSYQRPYHESRGVTGACPDPRTTERASDRTSALTTNRTTTLRQRQKPKQREQNAPAGAPHSLLDCVLEERSDWASEEASRWLRANLPKIEDLVDSERPRDRGSAIRARVRSFAKAERKPPRAQVRPDVTPILRDPKVHPAEDLARRRLANQCGIADPTWAQIRAHIWQFREQCHEFGDYFSDAAANG